MLIIKEFRLISYFFIASEKNQTPVSKLESLMDLPSATPRAKEEPTTERNGSGSEVQPETKRDSNGEETTFTYEQLKVKSSNPVSGIDYTRREV